MEFTTGRVLLLSACTWTAGKKVLGFPPLPVRTHKQVYRDLNFIRPFCTRSSFWTSLRKCTFFSGSAVSRLTIFFTIHGNDFLPKETRSVTRRHAHTQCLSLVQRKSILEKVIDWTDSIRLEFPPTPCENSIPENGIFGQLVLLLNVYAFPASDGSVNRVRSDFAGSQAIAVSVTRDGKHFRWKSTFTIKLAHIPWILVKVFGIVYCCVVFAPLAKSPKILLYPGHIMSLSCSSVLPGQWTSAVCQNSWKSRKNT